MSFLFLSMFCDSNIVTVIHSELIKSKLIDLLTHAIYWSQTSFLSRYSTTDMDLHPLSFIWKSSAELEGLLVPLCTVLL